MIKSLKAGTVILPGGEQSDTSRYLLLALPNHEAIIDRSNIGILYLAIEEKSGQLVEVFEYCDAEIMVRQGDQFVPKAGHKRVEIIKAQEKFYKEISQNDAVSSVFRSNGTIYGVSALDENDITDGPGYEQALRAYLASIESPLAEENKSEDKVISKEMVVNSEAPRASKAQRKTKANSTSTKSGHANPEEDGLELDGALNGFYDKKYADFSKTKKKPPVNLSSIGAGLVLTGVAGVIFMAIGQNGKKDFLDGARVEEAVTVTAKDEPDSTENLVTAVPADEGNHAEETSREPEKGEQKPNENAVEEENVDQNISRSFETAKLEAGENRAVTEALTTSITEQDLQDRDQTNQNVESAEPAIGVSQNTQKASVEEDPNLTEPISPEVATPELNQSANSQPSTASRAANSATTEPAITDPLIENNEQIETDVVLEESGRVEAQDLDETADAAAIDVPKTEVTEIDAFMKQNIELFENVPPLRQEKFARALAEGAPVDELLNLAWPSQIKEKDARDLARIQICATYLNLCR